MSERKSINLNDLSDLELAEFLHQCHLEMNIIESNLKNVLSEVDRRKKVPKPKVLAEPAIMKSDDHGSSPV